MATTIDRIPDLRGIMNKLQADIAKTRKDANTSFLEVNQNVTRMDLKIGDTAERARANLKDIDNLTAQMKADLAEIRKEYVTEIGSKGRIDAIEHKLGTTYDAAMNALNNNKPRGREKYRSN